MISRYVLIAILVVISSPGVWAGQPVQTVNDDLNFDEPFEQATAKSALRSLFNQALDLIETHIEIQGSLQPNEAGERRFQLRLYPHGKSQSEAHLSAELRFWSSPDNEYLSFDLKLPKQSSEILPYLPDNTL
jgi:hypothetical protein